MSVEFIRIYVDKEDVDRLEKALNNIGYRFYGLFDVSSIASLCVSVEGKTYFRSPEDVPDYDSDTICFKLNDTQLEEMKNES